MTEFEKAMLKELRKIRKALQSIEENIDISTAGISDMKDNIDTITEVYLKVTL